jgi:hypothetical protein
LGRPVPFVKIIRFAAHPNHRYIHRHPVPHEGRFAIVTNVGTGCGGRGSVERAMGSQGGFFRERSRRAQTRDAGADGEVVWSRRPGAGVKLAEVLKAQPGTTKP